MAAGDGAPDKAESEALKRAIDKVEVDGIFLLNSHTSISDSFSPQQFVPGEYISQGFSRRTGVGFDEANSKYGFKVSVGMRMVHQDHAEEARQSETDEFTCIEIRADFLAVYLGKELLSDEEQEAYHRNNVLYHVWPYWREFVQQIGWRMGAPFIVVPMLKQQPKLS